ncbi:nicotinate-nucleotide--dimethylbenzimidazole phosphoribosyltransferase [Ereboglobus sp. PH5-5]|uniref:nicotinate-nucleotide--dimethylbenzimidazole phosphoribosyltransferase n=1 Tax=Ereboglobus sp. PH5-5 TaxID=2940529 RepID=UPI0024073866|nr:nicotinate-nucleotide--dimethylbenzimidazole phosphoribosyltransferase [Ereboglobus sp. PH5-5]MDF9831939.1 nicotinate-nucleotide--dimethylbenzimidazole phosphoribosyltransferase [Ereboglobus sp. PH5-5]
MSHTPPLIPSLANELEPALRAAIDNKTKPPGSLGRLEEVALRLGLMQGTLAPELRAPASLVFAGDHGLADEGVSPFPKAVTVQMVLNFLAGGAAINVFARQHGLHLKVIDAGVAGALPEHPDLISRKVMPGTRNALREQAMTPAEVELCFAHADRIIGDLHARGCNAVIFGEMGIGNTSIASLLMSALTGTPLEDCTGRGAGHDPAGLARKIDILKRVQARHGPITDPLAALAAYGGCEVAMMAGAMLSAASRRMLVMNDGFIVTSALLVASRINPAVLDYTIFGHTSAEGAHPKLVSLLGGKPLIALDLRLGEGTGAALAWPLVMSAAAFLREMATFESAKVSNRE